MSGSDWTAEYRFKFIPPTSSLNEPHLMSEFCCIKSSDPELADSFEITNSERIKQPTTVLSSGTTFLRNPNTMAAMLPLLATASAGFGKVVASLMTDSYDFNIRDLKDRDAFSMSSTLNRSGDNLLSVIHLMESGEISRFNELISVLKHIVPDVESVQVIDAGGVRYGLVWHNSSGERFAVNFDKESDGTMRALALLFALLQPTCRRSFLLSKARAK